MRRHGYGWAGYNLPQIIGTGGAGVTRPAPALFWSTAYSPDNFSLVLANQASTWKGLEETTGTDLTQGTSGNQPVLVEDNTVTQFTANTQPTYDQISGVNIVSFGSGDSMSALSPVSGDFTIEIVGAPNRFDQANSLVSNDSDTKRMSLIQSGGTFTQLWVYDSVGTQYSFVFQTPLVRDEKQTFKIILGGTTLSVYSSDELAGSLTTSGIFDFYKLGRNGPVYYDFYSYKQWNSADSSGTPDYTLTADPTKMRTSANVNPVLGEGVAKWYADEWSGYRDNHVLFDPVKYMEGLPAQAGDFTYIFKYQDDDQATAGAIVSSNIDASGIFNVDGDTTDLRAGDATNYLFDNTGATSYRMVAYLKSGDDVYNVTDYVFSATQDATGKAFNLTSLGKATSGKDMKVKEFGVYGSALSGDDLDYFYYERDVNTGEILLVDGQPQLPVKAFGVNSIDRNDTSQYLELQGATSRVNVGTGSYATSGWVTVSGGLLDCSLGAKWDSSAGGDNYRWQNYMNPTSVTTWFSVSGVGDNRYRFVYPQLSDGVHHVVMYNPKGNTTTDTPKCYIDDVEVFGSWINTDLGDISSTSFSQNLAFKYGWIKSTGGVAYRPDTPSFAGVSTTAELTQADATYLYNGGTPLCWQDIATDNPTLFAKFDMTVDNGTYNNRTEIQALTDHTNGWVFSNVNDIPEGDPAPFTNQGLTVECSE